jgi:hypothetical protein
VVDRRFPYKPSVGRTLNDRYFFDINPEAHRRNGLSSQQFARYYLMMIGIGHDLTRIALDPKHPRRLASEEEVLALCPELAPLE